MSHPTSSLRASRRAERGAAVFIVVLVITLVSALGLFAMRSATLATLASGYSRQMNQTHYVTEMAMSLTVGELGGPGRQNYAEEMWSGQYASQCQGATTLTNSTCFPIYYADLEARAQSYNSGTLLIEPASGTTPGSLGPVALEGDFRLEASDIHEASPPIAGMDLTGMSASPRYYSVTLTAAGQVRPKPAVANQLDAPAAAAAGIENSRAHIVVGPLSH